MVMISVFTFALSRSEGEIQGFVLYRQIGHYNENIICMGGNGGCFTAVWGFWQGFTMQKAKVFDIPRGLGPWLQMTGA